MNENLARFLTAVITGASTLGIIILGYWVRNWFHTIKNTPHVTKMTVTQHVQNDDNSNSETLYAPPLPENIEQDIIDVLNYEYGLTPASSNAFSKSDILYVGTFRSEGEEAHYFSYPGERFEEHSRWVCVAIKPEEDTNPISITSTDPSELVLYHGAKELSLWNKDQDTEQSSKSLYDHLHRSRISYNYSFDKPVSELYESVITMSKAQQALIRPELSCIINHYPESGKNRITGFSGDITLYLFPVGVSMDQVAEEFEFVEADTHCVLAGGMGGCEIWTRAISMQETIDMLLAYARLYDEKGYATEFGEFPVITPEERTWLTFKTASSLHCGSTIEDVPEKLDRVQWYQVDGNCVVNKTLLCVNSKIGVAIRFDPLYSEFPTSDEILNGKGH